MKKLIIAFMALGMAGTASAAKVVLEGSTTVLPIAQKAAEVFMKNNPDADLSVRGGGSGVGIASIIDGTCDIADSAISRPQTTQSSLVMMLAFAVSNLSMSGLVVISPLPISSFSAALIMGSTLSLSSCMYLYFLSLCYSSPLLSLSTTLGSPVFSS